MAVWPHPGGRRACALVLTAGAALSLAACASAPSPYGRLATRERSGEDRTSAAARPRAYNRAYQVRGRWYTPHDQPGYDEVGLASWYSYESPSHTTADGEVFDIRVASAAHKTLPIPSWIEVTNLDNGRSARVRLNDRGPFVAGRILDLSRGAAEELGFASRGVARVRVRYLGPAETSGPKPMLWAQASRPPAAAREADADAPSREPFISPRTEVAQDAARVDQAGDAPSEMSAPAPALAAVQTPGGFVVQAGAFADRRNAERAAVRLADTGAASVRPLARADGGVLYRVVVGGWTEAPQAASARSRIAALGFADAKVVAP